MGAAGAGASFGGEYDRRRAAQSGALLALKPLPSLSDVRAARARLANAVHVTPVARSTMVDRDAGCSVFLKCENLQKTGSFKSRGALNAVMALSDVQRRAGVVTVSAGNHAQALAWAAASQGVSSVVVMPASATRSKVEASEGYGARVVFENSSMAAFERAQHIAQHEGLSLVHPFEDSHVIAGAGCVGLELLEQVPEIDAVLVPVGGGGLLAGIAIAVKEMNPAVRVFGVEPTGAAAMYESLTAGKPVRLSQPPSTIADGLAAPMAGELTYEAARRFTDGVVLVTDDLIADAMRFLITRTKLLLEPAGAAAYAALRSGAIAGLGGMRVAVILSGGNVDLARLAQL